MREAFCTALSRHAPPFTLVYPHTTIDVSSYYHICPLLRGLLPTHARTHARTHPTTDPPTSIYAPDSELAALRTGRADPRILDKVRVEAYAATVSLEKVAQVGCFFFKKKICICALIRLFMCPHTTVYVSSYYCMCPHTPICVRIILYVS